MFKRYQCTYCGESSDTRDHVIPQSADKLKNSDCGVPCCRQCSSWIGKRRLLTVGARAELVLEKLREHRLAAVPEWSKHDLDGLEGSMLRYVAAGEILRRLHLDRIAWACLVVDIDPCVNDVRIEAGLRPSRMWIEHLEYNQATQ